MIILFLFVKLLQQKSFLFHSILVKKIKIFRFHRFRIVQIYNSIIKDANDHLNEDAHLNLNFKMKQP